MKGYITYFGFTYLTTDEELLFSSKVFLADSFLFLAEEEFLSFELFDAAYLEIFLLFSLFLSDSLRDPEFLLF